MMKKVISRKSSVVSFIILLTCNLLLITYDCCAQSISSSELINNAKQYDGKTVAYEGEVIGDVMARGDYAWVNVNDGANAIGIWAAKDLIKEISYAGSYKARGDWVEITGIFHRACVEHGGDLDIHASAIRKIAAGKEIPEKIISPKIKQAAILLAILFSLWILTNLKRR